MVTYNIIGGMETTIVTWVSRLLFRIGSWLLGRITDKTIETEFDVKKTRTTHDIEEKREIKDFIYDEINEVNNPLERRTNTNHCNKILNNGARYGKYADKLRKHDKELSQMLYLYGRTKEIYLGLNTEPLKSEMIKMLKENDKSFQHKKYLSKIEEGMLLLEKLLKKETDRLLA